MIENMTQLKQRFQIWLITSPLLRTIIIFVSVILSGILTGCFVTEITVDGVIVWNNFYKVTSFYFLLAYTVAVYFYYKFLYRAEKNILKFLDNDYCRAIMRSASIPELSDRMKESIRSGAGPTELREFREMYKEIMK